MTNFRQPEQAKAPAARQHWSTDQACWRSYCTDLIYAAAQSKHPGESYAAQVARRRRVDPEQAARLCAMGRELHAELVAMYPEAADCLTMAWCATGEHLPPDRARQAWACTVARCARWLPRDPGSQTQRDAAERDRRAGTSDQQRQANAEAIARELV